MTDSKLSPCKQARSHIDVLNDDGALESLDFLKAYLADNGGHLQDDPRDSEEERSATLSAVVDALRRYAARNRESVREICELFDAVRRGKLGVAEEVRPWANLAIRELTGTTDYREYDAWRDGGPRATASQSEWSVGDAAVARNLGLVRLSAFTADGVEIEHPGGSSRALTPGQVESLRPPVEPTVAEQVMQQFGTVVEYEDADEPYHRKKVYRAALETNDLSTMAAILERIYRHPAPKYPEEQFGGQLEEVLFGEIAFVLDRLETDLVREARDAVANESAADELADEEPTDEVFEESERVVELAKPLARAITTLRRRRGLPPSRASRVSVCHWTLQKVEGELGCKIPDAVIAYVTGGLSRHASKLHDLPGLTAEAYGHARDAWDGPHRGMKHVCFDMDGFGNPVCFARGAKASSDEEVLLDHEDGMRPTKPEPLLWRLDVDETTQHDESVPPFEVRVQYITAPPPKRVPDTVTHPKFGDGRIEKRVSGPRGDKLTIAFDDGQTRVLLERFVEYT